MDRCFSVAVIAYGVESGNAYLLDSFKSDLSYLEQLKKRKSMPTSGQSSESSWTEKYIN